MKETIIILHGWGLTGDRFNDLAIELSKLGYEVLNPDLPGFGKEKAPERPLTLTDYADNLLDYYKKSGISKAVLVGHSFGGRVALKFDELYPAYVAAIVLSGTPGFTPVSKKRLVTFVVLAKIFKIIFKIPPFSFFEGPVRAWYYYVVGAKEFLRAEGPMRQTFKNVVQEDLVIPMRAVKCPTILIWGNEDIIVPVPIAERMLNEIKGSKLRVIDGIDHGLPFRRPDLFAAAVRNFLNSI